jgi:predicted DNA-binding protein
MLLHNITNSARMKPGGQYMTNSRRVMVQVPQKTYDEIESIAERTGQSVSATVRQMILMYMDTMTLTYQLLNDNDRLKTLMDKIQSEAKKDE